MMINATMCFLKKDNQTLFLYRCGGEKDIHDGWYVPPGGRTERNERGIDCIMREFREETGLDLIEPKLKAIATFYNKDRVQGGKPYCEDWCVEVFDAKDYSGKLIEEYPWAKPVWVSDIDLPNLKIYPGDKKILNLFDKKGVFEVVTKYEGEKLTSYKHIRVD